MLYNVIRHTFCNDLVTSQRRLFLAFEFNSLGINSVRQQKKYIGTNPLELDPSDKFLGRDELRFDEVVLGFELDNLFEIGYGLLVFQNLQVACRTTRDD